MSRSLEVYFLFERMEGTLRFRKLWQLMKTYLQQLEFFACTHKSFSNGNAEEDDYTEIFLIFPSTTKRRFRSGIPSEELFKTIRNCLIPNMKQKNEDFKSFSKIRCRALKGFPQHIGEK